MTQLMLTPNQKNKFIAMAKLFAGGEYVFGTEVDPRLGADIVKRRALAFDCSELVQYFYWQIGYDVQDGSYNQYNISEPVKNYRYEIGDLAFKSRNGQVFHVGIVISTTPYEIYEAKGKQYGLLYTNLSLFQKSCFAGIRRLAIDKIRLRPV